jgi:flagellar basal body-associated protein FliL
MTTSGYAVRMDQADTTDPARTRNLKRVALIAVIALVVLILVAVGVYVIAFVILSPMLG